MGNNEKENGLLFVISGPSGGGKGTVVKELLEMNKSIGFSVSATTRAPREGETDGKDYCFITREQFEKMIKNGEMLEYNEYCGNYYGTPKKEAEKAMENGYDLILEIDSNGAFNVKKVFPEAILIMIIPKKLSDIEERLRIRGSETEETLKKRLATVEKEASLGVKYDYVVINETGKITETAKTIDSIITAEHKKSKRMITYINNFLNK